MAPTPITQTTTGHASPQVLGELRKDEDGRSEEPQTLKRYFKTKIDDVEVRFIIFFLILHHAIPATIP